MMTKATKERHLFEIMLMIVTLGMTVLLYRMGPYKIVVLPGGIRGTLYKSTKSGFVSWAPDDDDDMNYRDEWLSGVIGKALF